MLAATIIKSAKIEFLLFRSYRKYFDSYTYQNDSKLYELILQFYISERYFDSYSCQICKKYYYYSLVAVRSILTVTLTKMM